MRSASEPPPFLSSICPARLAIPSSQEPNWFWWVSPHLAASRHGAPRPFADTIRRCPSPSWGLNISNAPLQASTSSVMGKFGEAFEDAEQLLVPRAPPDLHIAGAALRTEWPEPGWLVAALRGWTYGEAAERTHQVKRSLSLPGTGNWPSGMSARLWRSYPR